MNQSTRFWILVACVVLALGIAVWFVSRPQPESTTEIETVREASTTSASEEVRPETALTETPAPRIPRQASQYVDEKPEEEQPPIPQPTADTGVIVGRVFEVNSGEPVPGVTLGAAPTMGGTVTRGTPSGLDGVFAIAQLPQGRYDVDVYSGEDYVESNRSGAMNVVVEAGQTTRGVEIGLLRGAQIRCTVVDEGQQPVPGAEITISYGQGAQHHATGPSGTVEFSAIALKEIIRIRARRGTQISDEFGPVGVREAASSDITLMLKPGGSIAGRVVDADGRAVPEAQVGSRLAGHWTAGALSDETTGTADAEGSFILEGLGGGVYDMYAGWPGDTPPSREPARPDIDMETLRGLIRESMDEEGVTLSDKELETVLAQMPSDMESSAPEIDLSSMTRVSSVSVGEKERVTGAILVLAQTDGTGNASIAGHIRDEDGQPVEEAEIYVVGGPSESLTTGPDGAFRFDDLDGGNSDSVPVVVTHPNYVDVEFYHVDLGDENAVITMRLPATVRGRVLDATTGAPVPKFQVGTKSGYFSGEGIWETATETGSGILGAPRDLTTVTNPDGEFELTYVAPGESTVFVQAQGYAVGHTTLDDVAGGGRIDGVVVRLEPAKGLPGRVTNQKGEAIAGAHIQVIASDSFFGGNLDLDSSLSDAVSSSDGTFVLNTLLPGENDISVMHASYAPARVRIPANAKQVNVQLTAGGSLRVVVTYDGQPVSGAEVVVYRPNGNGMSSVAMGMTDQHGRYSIDRLAPSRVSVNAHLGDWSDPDVGMLSGAVDVEIVDGQEVSAEMQLDVRPPVPTDSGDIGNL